MQYIGSFYLENNGAFVCNTGCVYIDDDGNECTDKSGGNIAIGMSEHYSPGDHGVSPGSVVKLYIDIHAGADRTGSPFFIYDPNSGKSANYSISGTTLDSTVHFLGVS